MLRKLFATDNDYALTVVRAVLGIVFLAHGAQKMLGWFGGYGFSGSMGAMEHMGIPSVFAFLAIAAEFFGGLGLLLGLLGRVAAFGIAIEMAVAAATVHAANGFFMNWFGNQKGEGFEYHLLAIALGVLLILRGSGAFSLDRLIARSEQLQQRGYRSHSPAAA
ncbi:MAG: DoxX family protein [Terriglobales bacterium]